jgi:hypothetical protein
VLLAFVDNNVPPLRVAVDVFSCLISFNNQSARFSTSSPNSFTDDEVLIVFKLHDVVTGIFEFLTIYTTAVRVLLVCSRFLVYIYNIYTAVGSYSSSQIIYI